jgi:hypothetical protein
MAPPPRPPQPVAPVVVPVPAPPTPVPAGSSSAPWIVAAAAVVVLAVVGAVLVVTMRPASSAVPAPQVVAAPAPVTVTVTPSASASRSSSSSSPDDTGGGGTATLQAVVDADRNAVEAFDGLWVPQLSSKRPGTVDDGTTYDASSIYAHYTGLVGSYTNVRLLYSGDWSVYREGDYWVAIAGEGFATAASANAWCDARGFSADDCFAKRMSHTAGPAGSTEPRSS